MIDVLLNTMFDQQNKENERIYRNDYIKNKNL